MSEDKTFSRYLWDGLKSLICMPGALRSDKQKRLGTFLLLSGVLWIIIPVTSSTLVLQWSQLMIGVVLLLHGYYLEPREREERREEMRRQMRIDLIKYVADRDDVDLEEAEHTVEEMERWVREARGEDADKDLELAEVEGNVQVIENIAKLEGISIEEATEKVKKAKRVSGGKPWRRVE